MQLLTPAIAAAGAAATLFASREVLATAAAERLAAAALESLLNAIDANDGDTGAHVRRVAAYSIVLAEAAEVDEQTERLVEQVALFHDIGKIHGALIDIVKEGRRLTPAERRAIDTHPARGADVLMPLLGFYPNLPDGVLSHHEWWNGRGYPRKLSGRRIPLSARIVAIADTFDAITFTRRYKKGRSVDFALEVILNARGTQFDPALVDLFSFPGVFDQILATHDEVARWRTPLPKRRRGREENRIPDITFRWRPETPGAGGKKSRGKRVRNPI